MENQIPIGDQNNPSVLSQDQIDQNVDVGIKPEGVGNEVVNIKPKQTNFKRYYVLIVIFLAILLVGGGLGLYLYKTTILTKPTTNEITEPPISPTDEEESTPQVTSKPNVTLKTGFSLHLPTDWSAKISNQSKQHFYGKFFIPNVSSENSFVEIESISSSHLIKNPFITVEKTEQKKINNLSVVITEGKEDFQKSNRLIKQATFTNKGNSLVVTLYRKPQDAIINQFDSLVQSISGTNQIVGGSYMFIKSVYAAESVVGVDKNQYTKIEVMGDPLPERIIKDDTPYKDGYAKFYRFEAFKGQRLTTVAMEDRATNSRSFIRSELYDEQGKLLDQKDTRIEFDASYTGIYYYIVRSFNNQEGGYLLKVFDRNQTENLVYLKYADGSERLLDPTKSPPQYGEKEVGVLFQFINPIEIIDNRTVRYFAKPKEFESGLGLITTPLEIYMKKLTYQDLLKQGSELPENNPENLVNTKITKLSPSKVFIEPEAGGLFPINHHIVIVERNIGRYRFFTENASQ